MNARDEHAVIAQPKASASTVTPPKASAAASPTSCSLPKLATNWLGLGLGFGPHPNPNPNANPTPNQVELGLQQSVGEQYAVRSSMGCGAWASVPWLAVSHPSESTQHGLYLQVRLSVP